MTVSVSVALNTASPPKAKRKYQQYSLKFKKKAVAALKEARLAHGGIKALCALLDVPVNNLYNWEAQANKGLLKKSNAVAFSTNPSAMRRG